MKFKKLAGKAIQIRDSKELTWEEKYELIFSSEVAGKIAKTGIIIEWQDPDTSYKEDVRAYVNAVEERLEMLPVIE